jgi:hypothetical protein
MKLIVYNKIKWNIDQLRASLTTADISLTEVTSDDQLLEVLSAGSSECLIVPLPTDIQTDISAENGQGATEAIRITTLIAEHIQPEDCELHIVFTAESSPRGWNNVKDPRMITKFHDFHSIKLSVEGKSGIWDQTIHHMKEFFEKKQQSIPKNERQVRIEFAQPGLYGNTPFNSEVEYLLRAAFRDMSGIKIGVPNQGLSGSMVYEIEPNGVAKKFFAKVFPDKAKAGKEYKNFLEHVKRQFPSDYYPAYDFERRLSGIAYSLIVLDMVVGPGGKATSFLDLIAGKEFSVAALTEIANEALSVMRQCWKPASGKTIDLITEYLGPSLNKDLRKTILESENNCHRWFGKRLDALPLDAKIKKSIPAELLTSSNSKVCHGDLHLANIMVKNLNGKLHPVFIDFSKTGATHSLKDLVTLECDLIIRGMDGIKKLTEIENIELMFGELEYAGSSLKHVARFAGTEDETIRLEKVVTMIDILRDEAAKFQNATEQQYFTAGLLKALEVLSYGKLPYHQNLRATRYVSHSLLKLKP